MPDTATPKQRREALHKQTEIVEQAHANGQLNRNGQPNGAPKEHAARGAGSAADEEEEEEQTDENIFLFVPNLIGKTPPPTH